ncbi:MAG TPA: xylulokinase [Candidatus Hydrogenedens sp.]|nr:xylulokinase [Candidatus Hydrogenedens sp.]
MSFVIGIDVGTSGTKIVAINEKGTVVASVTKNYDLKSPKPGWAEQNPLDWKKAVFDGLSEICQSINSMEVRSIGLTGQMHGSVFLDERGDVLYPAILWCDQRTAKQCDKINEIVGETELLRMVSNPALTGFTAPKILWLRNEEPDVYKKVKHVLLPKDYIRYELTGEFASDVADASGTLLFNVNQRCWHQELLNKLEIPIEWLPKVYEGPEVTGVIKSSVAEQLRLPPNTVVVAGGGDQAAGGVGCGVVQSGIVSASLGTSGVVFAFSESVHTDPQGRVHTFCHSVPGAWHVMGVMLSAGGSLQWFRNKLCQEEITKSKETGIDPYVYITQSAEKVPIGANGLLFLPYLTGERTPHKDPYARGAFIGLSLMHGKAEMAKAVLEGVAFGMRDSVEIMKGMGIPINEVRISGGGARSTLWRQIMADVCKVPMVVINVDEGPAFGAGLLASISAGMFSSLTEACSSIIKEIERVEPDRTKADEYEFWYQEYKSAYTALAPAFHRIGKSMER